jgi:radical SAM superfamily enzyme YgiQ (UPF0313 family)
MLKSLALISPKGSFISNSPEFIEFWNASKYLLSYRQNWSGLSTALPIIAALTPPSYKIELVDENIEQIDFTAEYDIVAITAMTQQATRAYQIADQFRKKSIKVIIGGIHVTVLPDEAKQHCDSVVIGEAEHVWPTVLKDFEKDQLQPYYKSTAVLDLKDSPLPRYDLLKSKKYSVAWVQSTRGCPHDCEFCVASKVYGKSYRCKSADQVVGEIEYIKSCLGNIRVGFSDDNLLVNKIFSQELLEKIVPLNIRWAGQSDISIAENPGTLDLLRKSGCTFLFVGFESLSRANLATINANNWKLNRLDRYPDFIKSIQSNAIGIMGAFIFGFDEDTPAVFEQTTEFVINNNLYDAQFSVLTPFPGTKIRDRLAAENRLLPTPWENYSVFDVNYIPKHMTSKKLQEGLMDSYIRINNKDIYARKMDHFKKIQRQLLTGARV